MIDSSPTVPDYLMYLQNPLNELAGSCPLFILHSHRHLSHTLSPKEPLVGTQNMSQNVNPEWMNVKLNYKNDVHKVYGHPIT
jgi:hypothetical protein